MPFLKNIISEHISRVGAAAAARNVSQAKPGVNQMLREAAGSPMHNIANQAMTGMYTSNMARAATGSPLTQEMGNVIQRMSSPEFQRTVDWAKYSRNELYGKTPATSTKPRARAVAGVTASARTPIAPDVESFIARSNPNATFVPNINTPGLRNPARPLRPGGAAPDVLLEPIPMPDADMMTASLPRSKTQSLSATSIAGPGTFQARIGVKPQVTGTQAGASAKATAGATTQSTPTNKQTTTVKSNKSVTESVGSTVSPWMESAMMTGIGAIGGGAMSFLTGGSLIQGAVVGGVLGGGGYSVGMGLGLRGPEGFAPKVANFMQGTEHTAVRRAMFGSGAMLGGGMFGGDRSYNIGFNSRRGNQIRR